MTALPTLKQLQYLVAVCVHLNFTRAAKSCFVTQSTLSAGLKELEDILGAQLVERDRQTVLMTPAGSEAVERARHTCGRARSDRLCGGQRPDHVRSITLGGDPYYRAVFTA